MISFHSACSGFDLLWPTFCLLLSGQHTHRPCKHVHRHTFRFAPKSSLYFDFLCIYFMCCYWFSRLSRLSVKVLVGNGESLSDGLWTSCRLFSSALGVPTIQAHYLLIKLSFVYHYLILVRSQTPTWLL